MVPPVAASGLVETKIVGVLIGTDMAISAIGAILGNRVVGFDTRMQVGSIAVRTGFS